MSNETLDKTEEPTGEEKEADPIEERGGAWETAVTDAPPLLLPKKKKKKSRPKGQRGLVSTRRLASASQTLLKDFLGQANRV